MEKNLDAETLVEVTSLKVNPACYHSLCKGRDLAGWGGQVGPVELMFNGRAAPSRGPLELVGVKIALAPRCSLESRAFWVPGFFLWLLELGSPCAGRHVGAWSMWGPTRRRSEQGSTC